MIALAAQRGSLRYVLGWIEMSMKISVTVSKSKTKDKDAGKIHWQSFLKIITDMINPMVRFRALYIVHAYIKLHICTFYLLYH